MKKRTAIVLIVVLIGLALLWIFRGKIGLLPNVAAPTQSQEHSTSLESPPSTAIAVAPVGTKPSRLEQIRDIAQKSNRPIEFFGLVVDQNGNPIPDVKVTMSIRTAKETTPGVVDDLFDYPVTMTGVDGRFALTGAKGALLSLKSLDKPGYEASVKSLNRAHYWYWRDPSQVFHPDATRPEIFRMWKQQGAEKLVRKGIGHPIPYDGSSTNFDLVSGTEVATGGDLRVTMLRNPMQIVRGQRNFEWTATFEVLGGGLIESDAEQMFLAPSDGYQNKLVVHMRADAPDWTDEIAKNLYLKLRNGTKFGRAEVKVLIGSDRATIPFYVTTYINPSGSRNLEYDTLQNVAPSARSRSDVNP